MKASFKVASDEIQGFLDEFSKLINLDYCEVKWDGFEGTLTIEMITVKWPHDDDLGDIPLLEYDQYLSLTERVGALEKARDLSSERLK